MAAPVGCEMDPTCRQLDATALEARKLERLLVLNLQHFLGIGTVRHAKLVWIMCSACRRAQGRCTATCLQHVISRHIVVIALVFTC